MRNLTKMFFCGLRPALLNDPGGESSRRLDTDPGVFYVVNADTNDIVYEMSVAYDRLPINLFLTGPNINYFVRFYEYIWDCYDQEPEEDAEKDIASVVFDLDGEEGFRIENKRPWSLFGDRNAVSDQVSDFQDGSLSLGLHNITMTAYNKKNGRGGPRECIRQLNEIVNVTYEPIPLLTELRHVSVLDGAVLNAIPNDRYLLTTEFEAQGYWVDFGTLFLESPSDFDLFSLVAETNELTKSVEVRFGFGRWNSDEERIENKAPYSAAGNKANGDFRPLKLRRRGLYNILVTPYSGRRATGVEGHGTRLRFVVDGPPCIFENDECGT